MTTTPDEGPITLTFESREALAFALNAAWNYSHLYSSQTDYLIHKHAAPMPADVTDLEPLPEPEYTYVVYGEDGGEEQIWRADDMRAERERTYRLGYAAGLAAAPAPSDTADLRDRVAALEAMARHVRTVLLNGNDTRAAIGVLSAMLVNTIAAPGPVGLTDEQMRDAVRTLPADQRGILQAIWPQATALVRAIERAHGIQTPEGSQHG